MGERGVLRGGPGKGMLVGGYPGWEAPWMPWTGVSESEPLKPARGLTAKAKEQAHLAWGEAGGAPDVFPWASADAKERLPASGDPRAWLRGMQAWVQAGVAGEAEGCGFAGLTLCSRGRGYFGGITTFTDD